MCMYFSTYVCLRANDINAEATLCKRPRDNNEQGEGIQEEFYKMNSFEWKCL